MESTDWQHLLETVASLGLWIKEANPETGEILCVAPTPAELRGRPTDYQYGS
jgi:hypothetical protein